jgi:kynurenine--oxoglutarate transaminase/cysteine-S-conjugate beta-lyase/glutamine--phenylpyruvate transaminase
MARRALEDFAAKRLANVPKRTVWGEMTPLALEYKAVNLGQGFPNFAPPPFVVEGLAAAAVAADQPLNHQYCRPFGVLPLVEQLRQIYGTRLCRDIGLMDVLVTVGVTQGLNLACQAFVEPGDEVISFEPFFDLYANDIEMAGGVVKLVTMQGVQQTKSSADADLRADDWFVTEDDIRRQITPKTKAILLNTPQNVPGKVWRRDELEMVARIAEEKDLLVFADEVYMSLVYDGKEHISIASLPNMWNRTITFCSAGKTFTCTGWKIGWAVAPEPLIVAMGKVHAHQCFSVGTPLQLAAAAALKHASTSDYYAKLATTYSSKRLELCRILRSAGLEPLVPSGGYFVLASIERLDPKHFYNAQDTEVGKDWQFCRWMTKVIGVNAIPVTAFCAPASRPLFENYVRFAFCKRDEDLAEAGLRLQKLQQYFR